MTLVWGIITFICHQKCKQQKEKWLVMHQKRKHLYSKGKINVVKRQPIELEKIFTN